MSENSSNPLEEVPVTVEAFHKAGFRVTFATTAAKVDGAVSWLQKRGFNAERAPRTTPDGTPLCPKHNVPMRKREKQGDAWYSHNVGTEERPLWCKGYAGTDSPGWHYGNS
jgi:hypothetical protein